MKVLVGYAGVYGSTRGVAEQLAARLAEHNHTVDCLPVVEAGSVAGYEAFVLGSAVRSGSWLPEATSFVRRHPSTLARQLVWLFSVGLPATPNRWFSWRSEPRQIDGFRMLIHPREHRVFAGALTREQLSSAQRAWFRLRGGRYGDHRDWAEINGWAEEIADRLTALSVPRE